MSKLDIDLNALIIEKLGAEKEDWNSYLKNHGVGFEDSTPQTIFTLF